MNRRQFVAGVTAGLVFPFPRAFAAGAKPDCTFPKDPRARLAVASYPFREQLKPAANKIKLLDFPKMVVERFGVHGVEPLDEHFPSTDADYLAEFRQSLKAAQAHVVNIPVGRLPGSFYDPDEKVRQSAIAAASHWVDVAVAIGSPSIRAHIRPVKGIQPNVESAAGALRELASYGQRNNIVVNLENDDPASEDAPFVVQVIEEAGTPWLRALPDFCNSMLLNKGAGYNDSSVKVMFQHACNISHVKELESDEGKQYRVDPDRLFRIARETNYRGYFSIEWDSDGDPYAGTENLIRVSLRALA